MSERARARLIALFALGAAAGCADATEPPGEGRVEEHVEEAEPQALPEWLGEDGSADTRRVLGWLGARRYASWRTSGVIRPSDEGGSIVFTNDTLSASLERDEASRPVGSIAVRELYELDLFTPRATNILVKVSEEDGPGAWRWIEWTASDAEALSLNTRGESACLTCHGELEDAIMTTR